MQMYTLDARCLPSLYEKTVLGNKGPCVVMPTSYDEYFAGKFFYQQLLLRMYIASMTRTYGTRLIVAHALNIRLGWK